MKPEFRLLTGSGETARRGELTTRQCVVATPAFMPCASHAVLRAVPPGEVADRGLQMMICNAFHLAMHPGEEVVAARGGLHEFMSWPGALATDSGGYQVFSLAGPEAIKEEGVRLQSPRTGEWLRLTPERSVEIQNALGADLIMCFDECTPYPATEEYARASLERTLRWAERSRAAHSREDQMLLGIVQGSTFPELRAESARGTVALDFDAYAIGGVSVGEPREEMFRAVEATLPHLPAAKLRYVMGVGTPLDLVEMVSRGVDLFDCVLPTRNARHGLLYTWRGVVRLNNAAHREADGPLEADCPCPACRGYSRAYLQYLLKMKEPAAWRLLSLHNLQFYATLMERVREAVSSGTLEDFHQAAARACEPE
jgi:queuine tRNA-ribosyltransferase